MPMSFARRGATPLIAAALALQAVAARPAAAVGRRLDLATLTAHAGAIVAGHIVGVRSGSHPKYHRIGAVYVTVDVSQTLKGKPAHRLKFMQFAGGVASATSARSASMAQMLPEMPPYRLGEEVVLFLYPASSVGFTSPVGGAQGKFLIKRSPGRPATVISQGGNGSLAVSGSLPSNLTPDQKRVLRNPGAAPELKTFLGAVKGLAARRP
jgi:hypothetical protein